jgi:TonB family protein
MGNSVKNGLVRNSFWISLLLHLLLFLSLSYYFVFTPKEEKPPHYYVPAYTYHGSITPPMPNFAKSQAAPQMKAQKVVQKVTPTKVTQPTTQSSPNGLLAPSLIASSFAAVNAMPYQPTEEQRTQEEDPILLIGDQTHIADPLIRLIGKSLSAHFNYPETEGRLGVKGRAIIQMTLNPNGTFTDIDMLRSSGNSQLDAAALYAVNTAPTVTDAYRFLDKPKKFVIGFIFE